MSEVSCRAFSYFRNAQAAGVVDLEALCAGVAGASAAFDDRATRIAWDTWAELCERMAHALGSDDAVVRSARFFVGIATSGDLVGVNDLLTTWGDAYRLCFAWAGPSLFHTASFGVQVVDETSARIVVEVDARIAHEVRPSRASLLLVEGSLAVMPRAFGLLDAPVERLALDERTGRWRVTLPNVPLTLRGTREPREPPPSSLGNFVAGVAHEINNPLTYMLTNVWIVRDAFEQMPESDERAEMLRVVQEIEEGARRIRDAVLRMTDRTRAPQRDPAPRSGRVASPNAGPRLRVFVIDDDPLVGRALVRVLQPHDVETFEDGAPALEGLLAGAEPDVILCDLMMPGMSGMELWERVASLRPELLERFVFVTGGAFTERADAFLRETPVRVLRKPVPAAELRAVIAERAAKRARHA